MKTDLNFIEHDGKKLPYKFNLRVIGKFTRARKITIGGMINILDILGLDDLMSLIFMAFREGHQLSGQKLDIKGSDDVYEIVEGSPGSLQILMEDMAKTFEVLFTDSPDKDQNAESEEEGKE